MIKEIWINLPVKDIKRSKEFFSKIGFAFDTTHGDSDVSATMKIGTKNIVVMLFTESVFKGFVKAGIADANNFAEVLISFDAESRQEVDDLARRASEAGGVVYGQPGESQGWMYGCGFSDPDGHRWNALYMDMSKMPKS